MSNKKIFVNLPIHDLNKTKAYFSNLGFSFNENYTDDTAACMVISEDIYVMLLTKSKFSEFTRKDICDSRVNAEVILALSADSKDAVDEMISNAVKGGGEEPLNAKDYGFMYQRSFQDIDGHLWEVLWLDPTAEPPTASQ